MLSKWPDIVAGAKDLLYEGFLKLLEKYDLINLWTQI